MDSGVPIEQGVSEREGEVLALVGEHLTNAEIAGRLFISVRTVESHVSSLLRKLDAADRRALAALAPPPAKGGNGGKGGDGGNSAPAAAAAPALPAPLTTFVGRRAERAALAEALDDHRLVSAVGPGGVGKTRLALAVAADLADRYAQGCWYVDLVPVTDPAMIGTTVAGALGFGEQTRRSPTETVLARLADAEALVVLDNCEHLVDGVAGLVERLLTACPGVRVLVTSQARLGLPFEWSFAVPGLSRSDSDANDAVELFLERAAMVGWTPGGDDDRRRVAAICDALDGSALAIELAAARLATRGLDNLEAALGNRLQLLTGGSRLDERHRSVRSALDWSYGLLDPAEQALVRRVSVFAAPFTAEAAAAVADPADEAGQTDEADDGDIAESLAHLADQSLLVVVAAPGGTRYRALETIRQYGAELLAERHEDEPVRGHHLRWCRATAAALADQAAAATGLEPGAAFEAAFAAVADELRAALQWATPRPDRRAEARELAVALARATDARGLASEAQRRYEQAAALADDDADASALLGLAADVALARLSGDDALRLFRAAADVALRAGDPRRAALQIARAAELLDRSPGLLSLEADPSLPTELLDEARGLAGDDPHVEAAILTVEAGSETCRGRPRPIPRTDAARAVEVAHRMGDTRLESAALDQLSVQQLSRGEVQAAAVTSIRRTELLGPLMPRPDLAFEYSDALHMASLTSIGAGELATALVHARRRYDLPFHSEEAHLGINWLLIAQALAGDLDGAGALADEFMAGWQRAGRPPLGGFAVAADGAALVEGLRGRDDMVREWRARAVDMRRNKPSGWPTAYNEVFDAILALHRGDPAAALAAVAADPTTLDEWHTGVWRQWHAALRAEAMALADPDADTTDAALTQARTVVAGNPVATAIVDRAEALAAGALDRLPAIAADLAGRSRYQQARTLVLAGGDAAAEGRELMAKMHAIPMK